MWTHRATFMVCRAGPRSDFAAAGSQKTNLSATVRTTGIWNIRRLRLICHPKKFDFGHKKRGSRAVAFVNLFFFAQNLFLKDPHIIHDHALRPLRRIVGVSREISTDRDVENKEKRLVERVGRAVQTGRGDGVEQFVVH